MLTIESVKQIRNKCIILSKIRGNIAKGNKCNLLPSPNYISKKNTKLTKYVNIFNSCIDSLFN